MSGAIESMMKVTKSALKTIKKKERTYSDDTLYIIMTEAESTADH